jgi:hypothetical protein
VIIALPVAGVTAKVPTVIPLSTSTSQEAESEPSELVTLSLNVYLLPALSTLTGTTRSQ